MWNGGYKTRKYKIDFSLHLNENNYVRYIYAKDIHISMRAI